jgi:ribosomal protein L11 methyltransferase
MSKYYKLILAIEGEEQQENTIAVLNLHSEFESVLQEEKLIVFSFEAEKQTKEDLKAILAELNLSITFSIEDEQDINWNEQYEKSFQPITILDNLWGVRATFHPKMDTKYEIVIDPKMSFGTGHHETTKQVMEMMTKLDFNNKSVWDYGSGTGILAIMAELMGADRILANDNEEWAYNNSLENAHLNNCEKVKFYFGDIASSEAADFLKPELDKFEIIIANITKNILLESALKIGQYSQTGTELILSGFYLTDVEDLKSKFGEYNFTIADQSSLNNWTCMRLIKN